MKRSFTLGILSYAFITLSGCSSTNSKTSTVDLTDTQSMKSEIARLQEENSVLSQTKDQEIQVLRNQISTLEDSSASTTRAPISSMGSSSTLPPNPKPGECYARVLTPAKYETLSEDVLSKAASYRIETSQAQYDMVKKQIVSQEASYKLQVVPATYKTVTEKVLVSEGSTKLVEVPATYETVSERVLVRPAYTIWKKGTGPIQKTDNTTGEIMCLVEVPDEYKTVTRKVVKTQATTKQIDIPEKYKTVTRKVIDQPATTKRIEIPAQYKTVKVRTLVKPADQRKIEIPAEYKTITKRKLVTPSSLEWRTILCETNTTGDVVVRIQKALLAKGHNPGTIDGILGGDTMRAVNSYQAANKLPRGKLTMETIRSLGVKL